MKSLYLSEHTLLHPEKELYYTEIGIGGKEGPLFCTIWGRTERQSRNRAEAHLELLNSVIAAGGKVNLN